MPGWPFACAWRDSTGFGVARCPYVCVRRRRARFVKTERRRVEIARTLAANPQFILLDEPFAGVDPISVNDIKNIIRQLRDKGIGILITDHNVRETLDICERAYIVGEGRVIAEGIPSYILKNDQVKKTYLGDHFSL